MSAGKDKVEGFTDILAMAKELYHGQKGIGGFSQQVLVRDVFGETCSTSC